MAYSAIDIKVVTFEVTKKYIEILNWDFTTMINTFPDHAFVMEHIIVVEINSKPRTAIPEEVEEFH